MKELSDDFLIGELKKRFNENKKALHDLKVLTAKLEAVNRKLQESEAMKSNFLSNIRNEINNPLASIMGISEQVMAGDIEPQSMQPMAKMIYIEAFDLDYQLKNIFMAAELEAGETGLGIAKVELTRFIGNIVKAYSHKINEKGLKVNIHIDLPESAGQEMFFKTDPEKLQIIMSNIIANAIEFNIEGRKIDIRAWRDDDKLNISVEDEGVGIENEKKQSIFDRFKQLETGVRKTHKGHGLGLSVTKALMDIMNGEIRFTSIVGKGSKFLISIPEALADVDIVAEDGNEFIFESEKEL